MAGIIRPQTTEEKDMSPISSDGNTTGFISIVGNKNTAETNFKKQLQKEQKRLGNTKPFADQVAQADFDDYYQEQAKISMRKNGYVKANEIKPFKLDLTKYSDLKNFKLIDEKEVPDAGLTNRYKVPVFLKTKIYKYKGFNKKYRIMEDGAKALQRALKENQNAN